jgi:formate dehydrogenase maturation protein FdhE
MFKYIKNYITEFHCPYCGSNNTKSIKCENNGLTTIYKSWKCNICKEEWHEEYRLKKIHDKKFKNEYKFKKKDKNWIKE